MKLTAVQESASRAATLRITELQYKAKKKKKGWLFTRTKQNHLQNLDSENSQPDNLYLVEVFIYFYMVVSLWQGFKDYSLIITSK